MNLTDRQREIVITYLNLSMGNKIEDKQFFVCRSEVEEIIKLLHDNGS
jgi:hypothetical protein